MNKNNPNAVYNKEQTYKQRLKKLVTDLKLICISEKIPMFVTFAVADDGSSTKYIHDMVLSAAERDLSENRIAKILLYLNRFPAGFPDYIRKDIAELEDYLVKRRIAKEGSTEDGICLSENTLSDIALIADGLLELSANGTSDGQPPGAECLMEL